MQGIEENEWEASHRREDRAAEQAFKSTAIERLHGMLKKAVQQTAARSTAREIMRVTFVDAGETAVS